MKRSVRTIKFLDFCMSGSPYTDLHSDFDLTKILRHARYLVRNGMLQQKPRQNAMHHIRVRDISLTKSGSYAVILFTLADRDTVDATYEDIPSGETTTFKKKKDQGTRFSAHLIIRLVKSTSTTHSTRFLALLEETRGLSVSALSGALRAVLKKAGASTFVDSDGETKKCHPLAELKGHPSGLLDDELKKGILDGFILSRDEEEPNGKIDEKPLLARRDYQLRLKVVATNYFDRLKEIFKEVFGIATKDKFDKIRVQYTDEDGRPKTHDLDVNQSAIDALQSLTVRSATIKLDAPMDYNQQRVDFEFAKAVFKLAVSEP